MEEEEDKTMITVAPSELLGAAKDGIVALLTVEQGQDIGKPFILKNDIETIGRGKDATVRIDCDGVSRSHARIENLGDGKFEIVDLNSTNGTFVNEQPCDGRMPLADGNKVRLGDTVLKLIIGSDRDVSYHDEIYRLTTTDQLTQAHNKRHFLKTLGADIDYFKRYRRPMALALFDIDFFKKTNDNFGHLAGDQVLKDVSKVCRETLRANDFFARYGGEEFAIIIREVEADTALVVCEKVRTAIESYKFVFEEKHIPTTISIGLEHLGKAPDMDKLTPESLNGAADAKLYQAKHAGRNCVINA